MTNDIKLDICCVMCCKLYNIRKFAMLRGIYFTIAKFAILRGIYFTIATFAKVRLQKWYLQLRYSQLISVIITSMSLSPQINNKCRYLGEIWRQLEILLVSAGFLANFRGWYLGNSLSELLQIWFPRYWRRKLAEKNDQKKATVPCCQPPPPPRD